MNNVLLLINTHKQNCDPEDLYERLVCVINSLILMRYDSIQVIAYAGDSHIQASPTITAWDSEYSSFASNLDYFCKCLLIHPSAPTTECLNMALDRAKTIKNMQIHMMDLRFSETNLQQHRALKHLCSLSPYVFNHHSITDMANSFLDKPRIAKYVCPAFLDPNNKEHWEEFYKTSEIVWDIITKHLKYYDCCENLVYAWELVWCDRTKPVKDMLIDYFTHLKEFGLIYRHPNLPHECAVTKMCIDRHISEYGAETVLVYNGPPANPKDFVGLIWGRPTDPNNSEILMWGPDCNKNVLCNYLDHIDCISLNAVVEGQAFMPTNMPIEFIWDSLLYIIDPNPVFTEEDPSRIMQNPGIRALIECCKSEHLVELGNTWLSQASYVC